MAIGRIRASHVYNKFHKIKAKPNFLVTAKKKIYAQNRYSVFYNVSILASCQIRLKVNSSGTKYGIHYCQKTNNSLSNIMPTLSNSMC